MAFFHRAKQTPLTVHEQLHGGPAPTHVARALQELGVHWIPASSPQAKGRIERLFGTFQDRLRTELRLAGVTDRDAANAFLRDFLPRYNARFAQPPVDPTPAYRPWPTGLDPQTVFCFKYQRTVENDNTVTLNAQRTQLLPSPQRRSYAKATVEVHERLDGSVAVFYQGTRVPSRRLTAPPLPGRIPARKHPRIHPTRILDAQTHPREGITIATPSPKMRPGASGKAGFTPNGSHSAKRTQPWKPAPDHPWRHMPIGKAKYRAPTEGRTKSLNP